MRKKEQERRNSKDQRSVFMMWRRKDYSLLPLCCAQAEENETADGRLKSQKKGRGDKKKRPSAILGL